MKIAISTLACNGWSLEKSLNICRQSGIQALEIRMGIHEWSKEDLEDCEYEKIYEQIQSYGLQVSDLGTSVVVCNYNERALQDLERCAHIACLWKCKGLRIMLGNFRTRWSEQLPEIDYVGIITWLREADRIMERYNTQVWIETHNEFATAKPLMGLLKDAKVHHCHLIWDIMHPLEEGEQPDTTLALMHDALVHVHIKDGMPWDDSDMANYKYTKIGEGIIPIQEIIEMLKQHDYQGYYSLEWEGIWRKELWGPEFDAENVISEYAKMMQHLES